MQRQGSRLDPFRYNNKNTTSDERNGKNFIEFQLRALSYVFVEFKARGAMQIILRDPVSQKKLRAMPLASFQLKIDYVCSSFRRRVRYV